MTTSDLIFFALALAYGAWMLFPSDEVDKPSRESGSKRFGGSVAGVDTGRVEAATDATRRYGEAGAGCAHCAATEAMIENDCEDQGYTKLADGCSVCVEWKNGKRVKINLVKEKRFGQTWWVCPRCQGSYGEANR